MSCLCLVRKALQHIFSGSTILSCCRQTSILTEEKSNSDSQQQ